MDSQTPQPKRFAKRETETGRSPISSQSLPLDMVQKSVKRLGWVALMYAVSILAVHLMGKWLGPELPDPVPDFRMPVIIPDRLKLLFRHGVDCFPVHRIPFAFI